MRESDSSRVQNRRSIPLLVRTRSLKGEGNIKGKKNPPSPSFTKGGNGLRKTGLQLLLDRAEEVEKNGKQGTMCVAAGSSSYNILKTGFPTCQGDAVASPIGVGNDR